MSTKTVLIVEKDVALMVSVRDALAARGFQVEETTDGRGAPDLIRKRRPEAVVLAVDLDAGQNGYIICKKLKSDDEIRSIPVVIVGDPKGFGQHQKLKTRAEDYVGKPFEADTLVERIGNLVGFPPAPELSEAPAADISLESSPSSEGALPPADPDFEMVDAMFEDKAPVESSPSHEVSVDSAIRFEVPAVQSSPSEVGETASNDLSRRSSHGYSTSPSSVIDPNEVRELRAKVVELTSSVDDARNRGEELESKLRELEQQLEAKQAELDASRSAASSGRSDKDVFALKDTLNKKDKEILRLKSELNAKENELVEIREKENSLDQKLSDSSSEISRRDAQLKTLQTKIDQQTTDRRRVDTQLREAREEARSATAKLSTLQPELNQMQARIAELENELNLSRDARAEAESGRQLLETELAEVRGEGEALRGELDSTRSQMANQEQVFNDEIASLRSRIGELETESQRHQERAARSQQRLRTNQDHISRAREALQQARDALEGEGAEVSEELDIDELAEA